MRTTAKGTECAVCDTRKEVIGTTTRGVVVTIEPNHHFPGAWFVKLTPVRGIGAGTTFATEQKAREYAAWCLKP